MDPKSIKKSDLAPTRVLYIRNVPDALSEADLLSHCSPFGSVVQVLLLREKHHGFVEFAEDPAAVACLQYYEATPLVVGGQRLDFNYSGRQGITTRKDPEGNPPNRILLLTVTNLLYPVTVDVLVKVSYNRNE